MIAHRTLLLALATVSLAAGRLSAPPATNVSTPAKKHGKPEAAAVKPHNSSAPKKAAALHKISAVNKVLTADQNVSTLAKKHGKPEAAAVKPHNSSAPKKAAALHKSSTVNKVLTADQEVAHLQDGLGNIAKLRAVFTASEKGASLSKMEQFAQGAMTTELSDSHSEVWSTIDAMMNATQQIVSGMKGKSKADQDKMMADLENQMNKKALTLQHVREKAEDVQEQHEEEYLLGVLMQHQKWSMEKQLNTTQVFAHSCAAAKQLLAHHNASQPLAPQLAAMMDAKKVHSAGKVAAEKAAAKLFIQLAVSMRNARA